MNRGLIAAAVACLGSRGMQAFTIDAIHRAAGLSLGLIIHHFANKEDLLLGTYRAMSGHLVDDPDGFSLGDARRDCHGYLERLGVDLAPGPSAAHR